MREEKRVNQILIDILKKKSNIIAKSEEVNSLLFDIYI